MRKNPATLPIIVGLATIIAIVAAGAILGATAPDVAEFIGFDKPFPFIIAAGLPIAPWIRLRQLKMDPEYFQQQREISQRRGKLINGILWAAFIVPVVAFAILMIVLAVNNKDHSAEIFQGAGMGLALMSIPFGIVLVTRHRANKLLETPSANPSAPRDEK